MIEKCKDCGADLIMTEITEMDGHCFSCALSTKSPKQESFLDCIDADFKEVRDTVISKPIDRKIPINPNIIVKFSIPEAREYLLAKYEKSELISVINLYWDSEDTKEDCDEYNDEVNTNLCMKRAVINGWKDCETCQQIEPDVLEFVNYFVDHATEYSNAEKKELEHFKSKICHIYCPFERFNGKCKISEIDVMAKVCKKYYTYMGITLFDQYNQIEKEGVYGYVIQLNPVDLIKHLEGKESLFQEDLYKGRTHKEYNNKSVLTFYQRTLNVNNV